MKQVLILIFLSISIISFSQDLNTLPTNNWNTLRKSGFYESNVPYVDNAPSKADWLWGINIGHTSNSVPSTANKPYYYGAQIVFPIRSGITSVPEMLIRSTNYAGEGMWAKVIHSKGNHAIDGKLIVKEIEIKINTGADFVFASDYYLRPLYEVEHFIKENQHLPEIPSEKEMIENGVNVNEIQIKLLQKIEELTLYLIEQRQSIELLQDENRSIKQALKELKNEHHENN